jgi:phage terminase large subunit-like protein
MSMADALPDPEDADFDRLAEIEAEMNKWDPKARAEAFRLLSAMDQVAVQAWYCDRGRACDGEPHGDYSWKHARGSQWPPPGNDWFVWACMAGRGWGKTRTGAEYTRKMSEKVGRLALIAPTSGDVRDTMIEGDSGLDAVARQAGMKIHFEPSKRRVTFPSGARAGLFSAEEPDRLRGPQHGFAWLDEPAHMPQIEEVWKMLRLGLRLPPRPHILVTTTPKPIKWVRKLVADPRTVLVRGSTYENLSNLADNYEDVIADLEGTRIGRQELYGEILEDVEGALWTVDMIVPGKIERDELDRVVVAIDPAGTANKRSDETGIVAVGNDGKKAYVLRDVSGKYSPERWAKTAMKLYDDLEANAIVVETNFGADMVRENLRHNNFEGRIIEARASRGKQLRADPIVGLYEQGRVFHVHDFEGVKHNFELLEEEMVTWVPGVGASPNRVDALVWAIHELLKPGGEFVAAFPKTGGGVFPTASKRMNPIEALRRGRMSQ